MRNVIPLISVMLFSIMDSASAQETVVVDFGKAIGPATQRATGFLHSLTPDLPADELVIPLKPRMWRMGPGSIEQLKGAFGCHERVASLGAMHQMVVSDGHGYGGSGWPGDDGDWSRWEDLVAGMVREAAELGSTFHWDIWNEPDIPAFWNPIPDDATASWNRFKETWTHGYRTIRRLDSDAVIVGPSNSAFSGNLFSVTDFLAFAQEERVLPDLLSWHEWHPNSIVAHLEETRCFMTDKGIPEIPISINEYVTHPHQTEPGILVWYLAMLEKAKVHSAAHACWPEPDGKSNCRRAQLDGILAADSREPRSTWWVYRGYAHITGELVTVQPSGTVDGVGGYDPDINTAHFLFGRNGEATGEVVVQFANLGEATELQDSNGGIHVIAEHIPDSGWDPLPEPPVALDRVIPTENGTLTISLPSFGSTDAYFVHIEGQPQ
jgi:hypothetical protein